MKRQRLELEASGKADTDSMLSGCTMCNSGLADLYYHEAAKAAVHGMTEPRGAFAGIGRPAQCNLEDLA